MRCEKCKYKTKTTCQCQFGYEQASKEFLDGNCEKFIDKYKEEYTPIIAREIFKEMHDLVYNYYSDEFDEFEGWYLKLEKKYIGERDDESK